MIDVRNETLIPFSAAPAHIPGRPNLSTLHRWRLRGVGGVKLETIKIGGRRFTSQSALERFYLATTEASTGGPVAKTSTRRQREIDAADAELDAAGI